MLEKIALVMFAIWLSLFVLVFLGAAALILFGPDPVT